MVHAAAAHIVAADADTVSLQFGSYRAFIGTSCENRNAALSLRASAFKDGDADVDRFDSECLHGSVIHGTGAALVAFRARLIKRPTTLADTYTGQYYDLSPLHQVTGPYLELGRFCQADGPSDMTALRLAWAALSVLVDRHDVRMMIGCSSFPGSDPDIHRAALSVLRTHHLGPKALRPKRMSPMAFDLPEANAGTASLPQLLRSYLGMGGWVSDHAVRDADLDRLHVFTGLATDTIPETRKARLRALAKAAQITPS